jgi:hypothetical protein
VSIRSDLDIQFPLKGHIMSILNNDKQNRMVTGLFPDRASAERAYNAISTRGYSKDDVNLMMSDSTRSTHFGDTETELGSKAAEGAAAGAGIGGTIGAVLAGVAAIGTSLVIPGAGLVIAGPLAAALAGAGAGGVTGGLIGALIGAGIPEERVKHYEEGINQGGIVLGVNPRSDEDVAYLNQTFTENGGSHVIGTGIGAAAGAATGAAIGAVAGPVGMVAGAAIGGITGGLAGKGVGEVVNPKSGDDLTEHHLAKGVGASGGAAMGAAVGAVAGPIGMAAGAAIGGLAGAAAGRGAGEVANPKAGDELHEHNLAQGVDTAGGALAGAAVGAVGGPIGMVAGAIVGGVAGDKIGKGAAEIVNPKAGDELHEHNLAGGVGVAGGAATGAAVGAVGGPIGMAAGAAIGGIAGGMIGKGAGHLVNPTEEDNYWRSNFQTQSYYTPGYTYDDYAPAYALGYNNARRFPTYDQAEPHFSDEWNRVKGQSRLSWDQAKLASRSAWDKVEGTSGNSSRTIV